MYVNLTQEDVTIYCNIENPTFSESLFPQALRLLKNILWQSPDISCIVEITTESSPKTGL